jgi:LytS/YehU family sensor histidine kinase
VIDVPEALGDALVPSLIIQPLVENAVRHAVATSTDPVRLTIAAREDGGRLRITVSDTGGGGVASRRGGGSGVGLQNVRERLRARYGDDGEFAAGRHEHGGFVASFVVPIERRG